MGHASDLGLRRKTVRFEPNDMRYLDGLAEGMGMGVAELIRETALHYAGDYAARVKSGEFKVCRQRRVARERIRLDEHMTLVWGVPLEIARRRIGLGQVLVNGLPWRELTLPADMVGRLTVASS